MSTLSMPIRAEQFSAACPKIAASMQLHGASLVTLPEQLPKLLRDLELCWGSSESAQRLERMIFSDREERAGFSPAVLNELMLLRNVLEAEHPELMGNENDPYNHVRSELMREQLRRTQRTLPDVSSGSTGVTPATQQSSQLTDGARYAAEALDTAIANLVSGAGPAQRQRLGEILLAEQSVTLAALDQALTAQAAAPAHVLLGDLLLAAQAVDREVLNRALARQHGIPIVDAATIAVNPEAVRRLPLRIARLKHAMPLRVIDRRVVIAVNDPLEPELRDYFAFVCGGPVELVFSTARQIHEAQAAWEQSMASEARSAPNLPQIDDGSEAPISDSLLDIPVDEDDESVIGLVNKVINDAIRMGASDIHFEAFPRARNAQIRLRRDGVMGLHSEYPVGYHPAIVSRLKIMADLNIAEKRIAQDGKIAFGQGERKLDLRVSVIPTNNALEVVTVRILSSGKPLPLGALGMHAHTLSAFRHEFEKPHGLILVCGPTGSGKTTTLHSVLHELNTPQRKIWTAEDPVEIVQRNVSQVQMHHKIGWSFAEALRSFLRADPDVIMIGEIRDLETAQATIEASMTGHLVLSTLHTNSAAETLSRLLDLDVPAFNLADAIRAVLAQRLARKLCPDCSERYEIGSDELDALATEYFVSGANKSPSMAERSRLLSRWHEEFGSDGTLHARRRVGCRACNNAGYRGRLGLHELMVATPELRRLVRANAGSGEIQRQAIADGMKTLKQDGIEKVVQGLTDLPEVRTVCI